MKRLAIAKGGGRLQRPTHVHAALAGAHDRARLGVDLHEQDEPDADPDESQIIYLYRISEITEEVIDKNDTNTYDQTYHTRRRSSLKTDHFKIVNKQQI